MFRKALFPILCAASFAAAIPLHIGESWVWQVTNRNNLDLTYRSAVVVDSHSIPAGKVWTLLASDSVLKQLDTAKILVRPSGRQNWLRQSRFLSWELEPRRGEDTTVVILGTDTSLVWGEASSLEPGQHAGRFAPSGRSRVSVDSNSVDWSNASDTKSTPLPVHVWSDAHGLEQALTFFGSSRGWDWRLVSRNNLAIVPPQDALKIPAVNTEMVWIRKTFQQTEYNIDIIPTYRLESWEWIQWKILEQGSDSAGWKNVSIQQSIRQCKTTIPNFPSSTPIDTICQDPNVSEGTLWVHPGRGQWISPTYPILQDGWVVRWEDALQAGPHLVSNRSWSQSNSIYQSWQDLHSTRRDGQLVSYSDRFSSGFKDPSIGGITGISPAGTTIVLVGVTPAGPSAVRSTPAPAQTSWGDLSRRYPTLPIRWSTAAGRNGTLVASEIVQHPAALRGKTLFLQARLPDGRLWQGTHVVP
ncbi:MAG: hypothetical protein IPK50_04545 [Fibrobacterota bacterium]|nr:hypothetical protein [Fibrobacterota bacterium]QQS06165.1 MAG: hypothetical protein IPK50_04545 [Fibrobacterota bacterium]